MPKPLVIYHADCRDGFCALWVAKHALMHIEAVPAHYGNPPPAVKGREVYVLDFSYPRKVMESMSSQAMSITVLDHHQTAQAELEDLPFCTFDKDRSGAQMAADLFGFPKLRGAHWIVSYVADRDLWKWELKNSKEINALLQTMPLTFRAWDKLAELPNPRDVVPRGEAVLQAWRRVIEGHVAQAQEVPWDEHKILVANATCQRSETAHALADGRPFAVVWSARADGGIHYNLRSEESGVDVSEIAKVLGGGGHKHAAGVILPAGTPHPWETDWQPKGGKK